MQVLIKIKREYLSMNTANCCMCRVTQGRTKIIAAATSGSSPRPARSCMVPSTFDRGLRRHQPRRRQHPAPGGLPALQHPQGGEAGRWELSAHPRHWTHREGQLQHPQCVSHRGVARWPHLDTPAWQWPRPDFPSRQRSMQNYGHRRHRGRQRHSCEGWFLRAPLPQCPGTSSGARGRWRSKTDVFKKCSQCLTLQMVWKPNYTHTTTFSWEILYEPTPPQTTTTIHQSNPNI